MEVQTSETRLEDLRRLTTNLQRSMETPDMIWPLANDKEVVAFRLWKEDDVAVIRARLGSGTAFPWHIHDQDEVVVCYRGRLGWRNNGTTHDEPITPDNLDGILLPGEVVHFPPGQPHAVYALDDDDCWVIAISVPASESF